MKHTPGPWKATPYRGPTTNAAGICIEHAEFGDIADVIFCRDEEIDKANARLIAAAPDLLKACQVALRIAEGPNMPAEAGVARNQLIAVLASAARKACGA